MWQAVQRAWRDDARQLILVSLGCLLLATWVVGVLYNIRVQNGWTVGDWMIDYRQGFVRRGLSGELIGLLASVTHLSELTWLASVQIGAYAVFQWVWWRLCRDRVKPIWFLVLMFSPPGLLFHIFSLGVPGRKDILLLVLLAGFLSLVSLRRVPRSGLLVSLVVGVMLVFMHEIALFYGPYLILAAFWSRQGREVRIGAWLVVAAQALAALWLLQAHPLHGDVFCRDLLAEGYQHSLCEGIVSWQFQDARSAVTETVSAVRRFDYLALYAMCLALGVLPVLLWLPRAFWRPAVRVVGPLLPVWLASLPLFLLALDWGRFLHLHFVCTGLVLTLRLPRRQVGVSGSTGHAGAAGVGQSFSSRGRSSPWALAALLATAVGLLSWNVPICCSRAVGEGGWQWPAKLISHQLAMK
jgi:hypothetical protein